MKKVLAVVAAVVATASIAVGAASATDGPLYEAKGIGCGVLDRDGSFVFTTNSYLVWYSSGKVYLRCEAQGTPGDTKASFSGFACGLAQFGLASESKNTIGRSGQIQLTCTGFSHPGDSASSSAGVGAG
jgi:hypothetical protein